VEWQTEQHLINTSRQPVEREAAGKRGIMNAKAATIHVASQLNENPEASKSEIENGRAHRGGLKQAKSVVVNETSVYAEIFDTYPDKPGDTHEFGVEFRDTPEGGVQRRYTHGVLTETLGYWHTTIK